MITCNHPQLRGAFSIFQYRVLQEYSLSGKASPPPARNPECQRTCAALAERPTICHRHRVGPRQCFVSVCSEIVLWPALVSDGGGSACFRRPRTVGRQQLLNLGNDNGSTMQWIRIKPVDTPSLWGDSYPAGASALLPPPRIRLYNPPIDSSNELWLSY